MLFFFFNDTATTEIYTLSLHDALPILFGMHWPHHQPRTARPVRRTALHERLAARGACFGEAAGWERANWYAPRSEEHTSELQSRQYLVCRLLLEKKKKIS